MKNTMKPAAFAAIALGAVMTFTACGEGNETGGGDPAGPIPINLVTDIAPAAGTRVTNDQWETSDRIGLYMKPAGGGLAASYDAAKNVQMSVSDGSLTAASPIYYPEDGSVDFVAYYPYTASVNPDYRIPVDLSSQSAGLPVEILWSGNATNRAASASPVSLNFRYSLAKIEVEVTAEASALTAADFAGMTVSVEGMYTRAELSIATGTFALQQGLQPITLRKAGSTAASAAFEALVLPATPAADEVVFVFHVGGKDYPCPVSGSYDAATNYELGFTLDLPEQPEEPDPVATQLNATIISRTVTGRNYTVTAPQGPEAGFYTVAVNAGQLQSQLNALTGNNPALVKDLTLTGAPDAADFATLAALTALESLDMGGAAVPDGRIPNEAFRNNTRLKSVVLPASCTEIGNDAFNGCTALAGKLTIPGNVTLIESGAFLGCTKLTDLELGTSVQTIGISAFENCGFKGGLTLPAGLESIGNYAFADCNFTGGLAIPNSVTSIGYHAFYWCDGFNGTLTLPVNAAFTTIPVSCFGACSGFTGDLVIPNSVTNIGGSAFANCSGFNGNLVIHNVKHIGNRAFMGCYGFTGNLVIPDSVTGIEEYAFLDCKGFNGTLTLPTNAAFTNIPMYCFSGCSGLSGNLVIPGSVTSIYSSAFEDCSGLTGNLVIPNSVTNIYDSAFKDCSGFDGTLTLPTNAEFTNIPNHCFSGCNGLTGNLVIPDNITSIGGSAFYDCTGFDGMLTLPVNASFRTISSSCFSGCKELTGTLVIPDNVEYIDGTAFYECWNFTGLNLGTGVKRIYVQAFGYCSAMTGTVDVSAFAANVSDTAFEGCTKLTVIK